MSLFRLLLSCSRRGGGKREGGCHQQENNHLRLEKHRRGSSSQQRKVEKGGAYPFCKPGPSKLGYLLQQDVKKGKGEEVLKKEGEGKIFVRHTGKFRWKKLDRETEFYPRTRGQREPRPTLHATTHNREVIAFWGESGKSIRSQKR